MVTTVEDAVQLALDEASAAAASGDYAGALAILDRLAPQGGVRGELLRGRIFAQQGRYDQAIGAFRAVLKAEPGNADALQALALAEKLQKSPLPPVLIRSRVVSAALAVLLLVAMLIIAYQSGRGSARAEARLIQGLVESNDRLAREARAALEAAAAQADAKSSTLQALVQAKLDALDRDVALIQKSTDSAAKENLQSARSAESALAKLDRRQEESEQRGQARLDAVSKSVGDLRGALTVLEARLAEREQIVQTSLKLIQGGGEAQKQSLEKLEARLAAAQASLSQLAAGHEQLAQAQSRLSEGHRKFAEDVTRRFDEQGAAFLQQLAAMGECVELQYATAQERMGHELKRHRDQQSVEMARVRQDVAAFIMLTQQTEKLADICRSNAGALFGPDRQHRAAMEAAIEQLVRDVGTISRSMTATPELK